MAAEYVVFEDATSQHYDADGRLVHDVGARREADLKRRLPDGWKHAVVWVEPPSEAEPEETEADRIAEAMREAKEHPGRAVEVRPAAKRGRGAS